MAELPRVEDVLKPKPEEVKFPIPYEPPQTTDTQMAGIPDPNLGGFNPRMELQSDKDFAQIKSDIDKRLE